MSSSLFLVPEIVCFELNETDAVNPSKDPAPFAYARGKTGDFLLDEDELREVEDEEADEVITAFENGFVEAVWNDDSVRILSLVKDICFRDKALVKANPNADSARDELECQRRNGMPAVSLNPSFAARLLQLACKLDSVECARLFIDGSTGIAAHPDLDKNARKHLCRILDCKKLSVEACMHAAQNELLPLRVVVQVLFFEQARAAMSGGQVNELPHNIKALLARTAAGDGIQEESKLHHLGSATPLDDNWSISRLKCPTSKLATLRMKLAEVDNDMDDDVVMPRDGLMRSTSSRFKALCSIPTKPKRILSKLLSMNRSTSERH